MKKKVSIISLALSAFLLLGTACGNGVDAKLSQTPDYSKYTHRFNPYGYSGPSNGQWTVDGEVYSAGEDFRTVERFEEYKDAGFSIYLAQGDVTIDNGFNEARWEKEKKAIDNAYEVGLKTILNDQRLQALSKGTQSLLKENDADTDYTFENEEALDDYVRECTAIYKEHPGFYGLMLGDEPGYDSLVPYGEMYRALKRVLPDAFIQYNLLPMVPVSGDVAYDARFPDIADFEGTPEERAAQSYRKYLIDFVDAMGVDYIQYDHYPMMNGKLNSVFIRCLQVTAEVAKEKNLQFYNVTQTFAMNVNGTLNRRGITKADAYWLNNMLLGFGVKEIHYFTYWTKGTNKTEGEFFIDGESFITNGGEKTALYYFMKDIIAENQAFAPVIKQFNYQGSKAYMLMPTYSETSHMYNIDDSYTFKKLKNVAINKECALVTELYDKDNGNYLYMLQNTVNPENKGSRVYQTAEMTFSSEYTHVVVYKNGVGTPQKLAAGNKLTVYNAPGEAVFVLPY